MKRKWMMLIAVISVLGMLFAACAPAATEQKPVEQAAQAEAQATQSPAAPAAEQSEAQENSEKILVGFSTYSKEMQRCIFDAKYMEESLRALGYDVIVQFAEGKAQLQASQIENMIASGCKAIICSPIDGSTLTNAVQLAEDNGCAFISYAGLILNTPHIDYFVTDDLIKVGEQQGQYIADSLGLTGGEAGPFNIELVAGDPNDANARYFFNGAMSILQPYIDEGKLVVQSGQVDFDACSTMTWDSLLAQQRMDNILGAFYNDKTLDAVLCNNDSVALGVISALKSVGYGTDKEMPITTGQDANLANVKSIIAGEQSMTVYKNLDICAQRCAEVVDAIIKGNEVVPDDTETYNNGSIVVPTILCPTTVLDKNNYEEVVIESGYYTKEELGLN